MARILAVDDSEQLVLLIQSQLRAPEFQVVTARSGAAALELVAHEEFDLILLDVQMPEMDGLEVCRRLKKNDHTKWIPVIFLSGQMKGTADHILGLNTGAVDYILKPIYDFELLRARCRAMLQIQQELRREKQRCSELSQQLQHARALLAAASASVEDYRVLSATPALAGIALFDGKLDVVARNATFDRQFTPQGLTILASALGGRQGSGSFDLNHNGLVFEVAAEWLKPTELLAVRTVEVTRQSTARARLASREPVPAVQAEDAVTFRIPDFIGSSPAILALAAQVDHLRHSRVTVLIRGDSGTGKELVARALHFAGPNAHRPFIPIHCGAISRELIESELFGYVKGAFTGATGSKQGLFAAGEGGTIFLDEIAETSTDLQVKLLRVLQNREIRPVGANHPMHVDVRIVAATNKNLIEMVRQGKFREDLYHRLEVVTLELPPLRHRAQDIPALVEHAIDRFNGLHRQAGCFVKGIAPGALQKLQAYPWPGNVRELQNVLERVFVLNAGDMIFEHHLPERILAGRPVLLMPSTGPTLAPVPPPDLRTATAESQRRMITEALETHGWDMARTAVALGISRSTFYRRCTQLGIKRFGEGPAGALA